MQEISSLKINVNFILLVEIRKLKYDKVIMNLFLPKWIKFCNLSIDYLWDIEIEGLKRERR